MTPTSMYPTERVDINALFNLPDTTTDKFWVDLIPIAWLPYEVALKHAEWARLAQARSDSEPGAQPTEQEDQMLTQILGEIIDSWNVTDRAGNPLPQLRTNPAAWHKVPLAVINAVMERAQGDAAIPPQSGRPSSDGSTPQQPSFPTAASLRAEALADQIQEQTQVSPTG